MNTKNRNTNDFNLDLQTQAVSAAAANETVLEIVSELELKMTNMAFGYEYTLIALDDADEQGPECEKLNHELDTLKSAYIEAREMMKMIDEVRLNTFESKLMTEKQLVFKRPEVLH